MLQPDDPGGGHFDPGGGDSSPLTNLEVNRIIGISSNEESSGKRFKPDEKTKNNIHSLDKNSGKETNNDKIPKFYSPCDRGPFVVFIESTESSGNNIGRFNDLKIAKEIFQLKLTNIKKILNKGSNRISVEFDNYKSANEFIVNPYLIKKGYSIYIPTNYITVKGIVRQIHKDISIEELVKSIDSPFQIIDIIRLNRKILKKHDETDRTTVTYEPTNTILITFKGVNLPRTIAIYNLIKHVTPYVAPVTQCFQCLLYGHTKKLCKNKNKKCFNCGEEDTHSETTPDQKIVYSCKTKCIHCKSDDHRSTYKLCPEFERQRNIKRLIAYENITFYDASNLCPKTYLPNNLLTNPQDFPELQTQQIPNREDNCIIPSQRRTVDFSQRSRPQFNQVTSIPPTRKRTIQGYDKVAHNEALMFPNSRNPPTIKNRQPTNSQSSEPPLDNSNHHNISIPSSSQSFKPNQPRSATENALSNIISILKNSPSSVTKQLMNILIQSEDIEPNGSQMEWNPLLYN